jgi:hypothetical protein
MRAPKVFVVLCALFFVGACSWGDGSGTGDDTPGGGTDASSPVCGDGVCAGSEIGICTADCGSQPKCGNHVCDNGESPMSCPGDCPPTSQCGNQVCDNGETTANCPGDCPAQGNCPADPTDCLFCALVGVGCPTGQDMTSCTACIVGGGGSTCAGGFPNGVCDAGENSTNCPFDCM